MPRTPPPAGAPPSPEIFAALGEDGIRRMVEDHYVLLEGSSVRALFPDDMAAAARKSATFFVQVLGGPPLYSQAYGPPRMRQRHLPFEIDAAARDAWLACWDEVLADAPARYGFPAGHLPAYRDFLDSFSAWMVNAE